MTDALKGIHENLRAMLSNYSPPLTAKIHEPGRYELYSIKDIIIGGKERYHYRR